MATIVSHAVLLSVSALYLSCIGWPPTTCCSPRPGYSAVCRCCFVLRCSPSIADSKHNIYYSTVVTGDSLHAHVSHGKPGSKTDGPSEECLRFLLCVELCMRNEERLAPCPSCASPQAPSLDVATTVLGKPLPISRLRVDHNLQVAGQSFARPALWFTFQQTKFVYGSERSGRGNCFSRLQYPAEATFESYLACRGFENEAALALARDRWGRNVLNIPMPAFMDLFAEHAVAPFFVFQVK